MTSAPIVFIFMPFSQTLLTFFFMYGIHNSTYCTLYIFVSANDEASKPRILLIYTFVLYNALITSLLSMSLDECIARHVLVYPSSNQSLNFLPFPTATCTCICSSQPLHPVTVYCYTYGRVTSPLRLCCSWCCSCCQVLVTGISLYLHIWQVYILHPGIIL